MSITINATLTTVTETSFKVEDDELDVMVANGVDVTDEFEVARFYRDHLGEKVNGVPFADLWEIAEDQNTKYKPEILEWDVEGEAPDRFWPEGDEE